MLSTFIKLPFVIRSLFCLFLSGRFTQVLHRFYCMSITVQFLERIRHPLLSEAPSSNALGSPHLWRVMYTLICLCDDYVNALELLNY